MSNLFLKTQFVPINIFEAIYALDQNHFDWYLNIEILVFQNPLIFVVKGFVQRNIPSRYIAAALFIPISFENFLKKRMCKRMSRENRVTWLPALERKALVLFSFFLFLGGLHVFYFNSVGSQITWFISSWQENNCYVKSKLEGDVPNLRLG